MNKKPKKFADFAEWMNQNVIIKYGHCVVFEKAYKSYYSDCIENDKIPYSELDFSFYFLNYFGPDFMEGEVIVANTGYDIVFGNLEFISDPHFP